jgi:hypothetical protein
MDPEWKGRWVGGEWDDWGLCGQCARCWGNIFVGTSESSEFDAIALEP